MWYWFDALSYFSLSSSGRFGKNVIIFRLDKSPSVYPDNRKKDLLILGKGPTDGLDDTKITAEAVHSTNFIETRNKVLSRSGLQWK